MNDLTIDPALMRSEELEILRRMALEDVPLDPDHVRALLGHIAALEDEIERLKAPAQAESTADGGSPDSVALI